LLSSTCRSIRSSAIASIMCIRYSRRVAVARRSDCGNRERRLQLKKSEEIELQLCGGMVKFEPVCGWIFSFSAIFHLLPTGGGPQAAPILPAPARYRLVTSGRHDRPRTGPRVRATGHGG
jgi:hypothetical protein